ncbi:MAG: hypothetical protein IKK59_05510 [Lachnospiraceae bacterium]|nr:hypothetical protein [Lachnospiraceae bacterium]
MATHLVTGYAGSEHIKSEDQGSFNASFFGTGQFVMEAGNQLEASILDNNTVRILDGDILMKGRHIRINSNTYEDMIIETGTAGVNRCDLIVMEYSKDATTGIEAAFLRVLKGAETAGAAEPPAYTDGNILNGAKLNQMPLYKAMIEGVVLTDIECLFETIPTYETLARKYAAEFKKEITDLKTTNILDTLEEVEANDQENMIAGALSLKEMNAAHKSDISAVNKSMEEEFKKVVEKTDIIDNLESTETEKPLSAKQGKVLDGKIKNWTSLNKTYKVPTTKALSYTGVSIPIPSDSFFSVTVVTRYNYTQPSSISICGTSSGNSEYASAKIGADTVACTFSGYSHTGMTLYILANWAMDMDSQSDVVVNGFYYTIS